VDAYSPIRGKCTWWRETPDMDDEYDSSIREGEKRIRCLCFVEGRGWGFKVADLPVDCPDMLHCRYYIRTV
jgi:hypothetical protein